MKNNLIANIDTDKLKGKSIAIYDDNYVIVKAFFKNKAKKEKLYLTLLNNHLFKDQDSFNEEVEKIQSKSTRNYVEYLNKTKSSVDVVVLEITNPLLRDEKFDDYHLEFSTSHQRWHYVDGMSMGPDFSPFEDFSGNIISKISKLQFPKTIKGLRKILAKSMPQEIEKEYIQQYKNYCLTTIKKLLANESKLINSSLKELQQKTKSLKTEKEKNSKKILNLETNNDNFSL